MIPNRLKKDAFRFCLISHKQKFPFQKKWQSENNYKYDDDILKKHIQNGGNYGIIGGYGSLLVIDFDDKQFEEKFINLLPKTLKITTGSGGTHLYYICENPQSFKILDSKKKTLADIQGRGKQVVAPGSTHPNGNKYSISNDVVINKISLDKIRLIFSDYLSEKHQYKNKHGNNDLINEIKSKVSISTIMDYYNYNRKCNPTMCKLGHSSKGGKCFSYNENNDLWYCHHCDEGGDVFNLVMLHENCKFIDAKNKLMEIGNISNSPLNKIESSGHERPYITLMTTVLHYLSKNDYDSVTEAICKYMVDNGNIYTIRDDDREEVWIYDDGIYKPHGKTYIMEFCRKVLKCSYRPGLVIRVLEKIRADTFIDKNEFFKNEKTNLIPLKNGIYDIKENKLIKFDPKYFFFSRIPVNYCSDKKCDNIINFIKSIVSSESDLDVIQEIFGYLLYREYKIEKAIMFLGSGRNGKGKLNDLMKRFIGIDNCANVSLQSLETNQFALCELHNKLANLSADISSTSLHETGNFKSLTGRDLFSANRKFKTDISFVNYAKMIFSANQLPRTTDLSNAFFLRWVIIDFPYRFVGKKDYSLEKDNPIVKKADPEIIDKILNEDELSGLFNWSIIGLNRLLGNGDFSYSASTEEVKKIWLRKSSSLLAFVMDCCVEKYDSVVPKEEFRKEYNRYCSIHKITPENDKIIFEGLATSMGVVSGRKIIENERVTCWMGIMIKKRTEWQGWQGFSEKYKTKDGKGGKGGKGFQNDIDFGFQIERSQIPLPPLPPLPQEPKKIIKLYDFIRKYPYDNKNRAIEIYGLQKVDGWLEKGMVFENPSGTIRMG